MSHPQGKRLHGVHTLQALKMRCVCDDETGCWRWRGAVAGGRHTGGVVWLPLEGRVTTTMRAAWLLGRGKLPEKHTVWRTCRSSDCCNPAHMRAGTKAQWGEWQRMSGHLRGRPERKSINRRIKVESGQTHLTMEIAAWVRESPQTGREVAHAIAATEQTVSKIRTRKTWAPMAAASVFAWAGMGVGRQMDGGRA